MSARWIASIAGLAMFVSLGQAHASTTVDQDLPSQAQDQEPLFEEQAIFESGTHGYACIRIPAAVAAADGSLLAFAEGRIDGCADHGRFDLIMRRSQDGGRTWGPLQVVISGNGDTIGNATPVVDQNTGRVILLTTWNAMGDTIDRRPFVSYSDDHGATWSDPVDITDDVKLPHWEGYATGPGHAIQLERGPHAGRLVAGANHTWGSDRPEGLARGAHLLYSDDGGDTWEIGAVDSVGDNTVNPQELNVVELVDGRIYAAARDQFGTHDGNRAFAISSGGGESFDARFATIPGLSAPIVQGATLRVRATDAGDDHNRIIFSAPAHPGAREAMSIRSSFDEGQTWQHWNDGKIIHWGPAGYSDLMALPNHEIGLFYEAGDTTDPYATIRFARFNEAFLAVPNDDPPGIPEPPEPGPTTPDLARISPPNTAYVRGNPELVDGPEARFGQALELDGTDDHIELPFTDALDLDDDDFTITTWFRYGESSASQVIFWAYGLGTTQPSLWLRAEPNNNRLTALLTTANGGGNVTSSQTYDDGEWHHVALRRSAGLFELWVDGEEVDSAAAPEGSLTIGREFGIDGIYVGQRLDGVQRFRGGIDEVRIYRRALSARELGLVRTNNVPFARDLVLRLPLEQIDPE